jgi:hypothetical protein
MSEIWFSMHDVGITRADTQFRFQTQVQENLILFRYGVLLFCDILLQYIFYGIIKNSNIIFKHLFLRKDLIVNKRTSKPIL